MGEMTDEEILKWWSEHAPSLAPGTPTRTLAEMIDRTVSALREKVDKKKQPEFFCKTCGKEIVDMFKDSAWFCTGPGVYHHPVCLISGKKGSDSRRLCLSGGPWHVAIGTVADKTLQCRDCGTVLQGR